MHTDTFDNVIQALYDHGEVMTTAEIEQALSTAGASGSVSGLTTKLVNDAEAFSPIKRIREGLYTLTPWGREMKSAGFQMRPDKRPTTPPNREQQQQVVTALIPFLKELPEGLQLKASLVEVLQAFAAESDVNWKLVNAHQPRDFLPALQQALAQVDLETGGVLFDWEADPDSDDLVRRTEMPGMINDLLSWTHGKRLDKISEYLGGNLLPATPEHTAQIELPTGELVFVGQLGEHITRSKVAALISEADGRKVRVYAMGRVSPEALDLAAREPQITIHSYSKTRSELSQIDAAKILFD